MESIIHADIFFFIASIALVVCSIVLITILILGIGVLLDIKKITGRVRTHVERASDHVDAIVDGIKEDGVISTVSKLFHHEQKKRTRKSK